MRICSRLLLCIAFASFPASAFADGPQVPTPHVTYGTPAGSPELPFRGDVCQYGFVDTAIGYGWTLWATQQLGITCASPGSITAVGFYIEFVVVPGSLDIVIYDNGVEVSRTAVAPVQGVNEFAVGPVGIAGDACIMLCPTSFFGVSGEDYGSGPFGNTYWSTDCHCTTPFVDNNLTIWADTGDPVSVEPVTWGTVRALYR